MPTVTSAARAAAVHPHTTQPIPLKMTATENDSGLSIKLRGTTATISDVGANRGMAPSFASFNIEGKVYTVDVSRGMTAQAVMEALQKQLPRGVRLVADASRPLTPGAVAFFATRAARHAAAPRLAMKATGNDPTLSVKMHGTATTVAGLGSNRGMVPSFVTFTIDHRDYSVDVARGMTPAQVMAALQKKLPTGIQLVVDEHARVPQGTLAFFATRRPAA